MPPPLPYRRVLYFEEQRFPQLAVTLFLCGLGAMQVIGGSFLFLLSNRLFGRPPSHFLLFCEVWLVIQGLVLIVLRYAMRLRVIVGHEGIRVGIHPMPLKHYPWKLFASCHVRSYRAFLDHGGWGSVRLKDNAGWAHTAWGDRGVALKLTNGQTLFIGSQNPEELYDACQSAIAAAAAGGEGVTPPERSADR